MWQDGGGTSQLPVFLHIGRLAELADGDRRMESWLSWGFARVIAYFTYVRTCDTACPHMRAGP
jgi:hypothetical protein